MKEGKNTEQLNDKWLRIIGIPVSTVIAILIAWSFYREYLQTPADIIRSSFAGLLIAIFVWETLRRVLIHYRVKFPGTKNTLKRGLRTFFVCFGIITVFISIYGIACDITLLFGEHFKPEWGLYDLGIAMLFVLIIGSIYEVIYYIRELNKSQNESEELRRINLQSEINLLKTRVNPHFLFNSLNSLSALIDENPETSKRYVNELAQVYRYVLRSTENELTTLGEELEFINAYLFLLKTRYGESLQTTITIDDKEFLKKIPPMTIQMLVENAVKHNTITNTKPLYIKVQTDENNFLLISNNLQKKKQFVPSNKVGLSTIQKRYELLGANGMKINETEMEFVVTLPLIENTN